MINQKLKLFISVLVFFGIIFPSLALSKDYIDKEPPKSLDKPYPPINKERKWVDQMHKLSGVFIGVLVNMRENDWENAETHASHFVKTYEETSKIIPEWKDYFDNEAAKNFGETVKIRNPGKIWKTVGALGKTCGKCHKENYIAVWTRHSWPSVKKNKLSDPVTEKKISYGKFMWKLAGSFHGMTVNFGEKQFDRALKATKNLKSRMIKFKSLCSKCHVDDSVKNFFVSPSVFTAIDFIQVGLAKSEPNAGVFWKGTGMIGKQACKRCHLTASVMRSHSRSLGKPLIPCHYSALITWNKHMSFENPNDLQI
jgi:hypothetical protein